MKDLDTITNIALECARFGQINCCQRLYKVAQRSINRSIWSHWFQVIVTYSSTNDLFRVSPQASEGIS